METLVKILSKSSIWRVIVLILVLLGTNPYSFFRLARAADAYAAESQEEVFIQLGHTQYAPLKAKYKRFLSKQELLEKIREADLAITQGGFGSIADCLLAGKKVVAVPRKPELKESPDRQEELVRELEKLERLVGVYNIDQLTDAIQKSKNTELKNTDRHIITNLINKFIALNQE
jgi:UDP-N-acetylglucosamine transferase subunit ALG13